MADIGQIVGSLVGGAASPAEGIIAGVQGIIGMFKLDPTKKAEMVQQLTLANLDMEKTQLAAALQQAQMQADTNKQEAANVSWFVAGWRPACGWACVLALFVQFFVAPLGTWIAALLHHPIVFPLLDMATLLPLLAGMLGLGAMRTIEKIQDSAGNH